MRISVVVPTSRRAAKLESTLDSLAGQHPPEDGFEVVVVADGPDRETAAVLEHRRGSFPVPVVAAQSPARGPAAARNAGLALARGELVLFLGDDTVPASRDLVLRHMELHAGTPPTYAVLGRVVWDESTQQATAFMRWLGESAIQFGFEGLVAGPVPAYRYFYSAHVSLKRDLVRDVGGFDQRFPFAAVEDVELGGRLEDAGMELEYHPELVVAHDHPITLAGSLLRAERVGRSAALYHALHPERAHPDLRSPVGWRWSLLATARPLLLRAASLPVPALVKERLWRLLHLGAYFRGYRLGPPSA